MPSKSGYLHDGLEGEDHNKQDIKHVEDIGHQRRLVVMFYRHGNHVEEDHHDDTHLKLTTVGYVIKYTLDFVLQKRYNNYVLIIFYY